ncbi:zinc finger protein 678-like isoform X2 [Dreissena polymorpha]|nr:zinc finger protein 678-like isoform X2 [Dreissena polymorpha]
MANDLSSKLDIMEKELKQIKQGAMVLIQAIVQVSTTTPGLNIASLHTSEGIARALRRCKDWVHLECTKNHAELSKAREREGRMLGVLSAVNPGDNLEEALTRMRAVFEESGEKNIDSKAAVSQVSNDLANSKVTKKNSNLITINLGEQRRSSSKVENTETTPSTIVAGLVEGANGASSINGDLFDSVVDHNGSENPGVDMEPVDIEEMSQQMGAEIDDKSSCVRINGEHFALDGTQIKMEPEFDTDGDGDADMEDAEELEDYFTDQEGATSTKKRRRRRKQSENVCKFCGRSFRCQSILSKHIRLHTGEKPFKCSTCDAAFRLKSYLLEHERTHTGEKPFVCGECGASFKRGSEFSIHKRQHNKALQFKCEHCEKTFTLKKSRDLHMLTHTGERPWVCSVCGFAFFDRVPLRNHMKNIHQMDLNTGNKVEKSPRPRGELEKKECLICHKRIRLYGFQQHMDIHTGNKRYKCEVCGQAFIQRGSYHIHKKRHEPVKDFPCRECGKEFVRRAELDLHMRTHQVDEKGQRVGFTCEICGKVLMRKESYDDHMSIHKEVKSIKCSYCDKCFYTKRTCKSHERSAHENQPMKFDCQECGRSFDRPAKLNKHMEIHSGDKVVKQYACEECGEIFESLTGKSMHLKKRHRERYNEKNSKPFECEICSKKCKTQVGLDHHVKVHNVEGDMGDIEDNIRYKCTQCGGLFTTQTWNEHTCEQLVVTVARVMDSGS